MNKKEIIKYIEDCRAKGWEDGTIVDQLRAKLMFEEFLK